MRSIVLSITALTFIFSASFGIAQNKVVVIPLNSAKELKNVITVSAQGGDFTDPVAAVNSITGASAANPYLVLIGPGVYTLTGTLAMKPYVTIAGAGQEATKLTGAISSDTTAASAVVAGADNATLRDLTVENTGGSSSYSIAVHNSGVNPVTIRDVTATASGGTISFGVFNSLSLPIMDNVTAKTSGVGANVGVYNFGSSASMANTTATAGGGISNYGVWNIGSVTVTMTNVTATGTGSVLAESYGIYNSESASPLIRSCKADGSTNGIYVSNSTVRVMQSSIVNGVDVVSGTLTCVTSDDGFTHALDGSCAVIP